MTDKELPSNDPNRSRKLPLKPGRDTSLDKKIDDTIEIGGLENSSGDSTIVPEVDLTIELDGYATNFPHKEVSVPQDQESVSNKGRDGEQRSFSNVLTVFEDSEDAAVIDLDETPINLDSGVLDLDHPSAEGSAIHGNLDLDKTIANTEETVVEERTHVNERSIGGTRIYQGKGKSSKKTISDLAGRTKSNLDGSIMASADIDVTINPRELSEKDTIAWDQAVGDGGRSRVNSPSQSVPSQSVPSQSVPSQLGPAIERTFSDRQFEKLRICRVAQEPSDKDVTLDFKLVKKLGQGGMGDVFLAHQSSLDRRLALKLMRPVEGRKRAQLLQTGKLEEFEENRRQQFLSEAIVTSDLDHPNIVPIHDAGFSSDGELFYAMKCVVGDAWSDKIKTFSRDENVDVLMKVCDAIACAHDRGVVHRDIKPQNVMLGKFGVVLVMDWGLALPTPDYEKAQSILATSGLGGTPAFMAPEMAAGPIHKIGPASDVYLLGATLFLIVTGQSPHQGRNVTECMNAVRNNEIRDVSQEFHGELLDIALKAMASDPKNRYAKVEDFQQAIRDYRSHVESISLATSAQEFLEQAKATRSDSDFSRATFGFEAATKSWSGNVKAHHGLADAILLRAQSAYEKGNFELGLSLLDENNAEHIETISKIRSGMHEAQQRKVRLARLQKIAAAMLAFILIGGSVAFWVTNQARRIAEDAAVSELEQRQIAEQKTEFAESQRIIADEKTKIATDQKAIAEREKENAVNAERAALQAKEIALRAQKSEAAERAAAVTARDEAQKQKRIAEEEKERAVDAEKVAKAEKEKARYEEYVSKIGLAKAKLQDNDAENARLILDEIRSSKPQDSWEWRWLWEQANQSTSDLKTDSPIIDLSMHPSGRRGVMALSEGDVLQITLDESGKILDEMPLIDPSSWKYQATSVAYSPISDEVAVGTSSGEIVIVGVDKAVRTLGRAHTARVSDLQFSRSGVLASGSVDRTVRFWDSKNNTELTKDQACWHLAPVQQIALSGSGASMILAVATAEESTGSVTVWNITSGDSFLAKQQGIFQGHKQPVVCVTLSPDGTLAGSGDVGGNVFLWNPWILKPVDYSRSVASALTGLKGDSTRNTAPPTLPPIRFARLIDDSDHEQQQFVSNGPAGFAVSTNKERLAHQDVVRSMQFSSDGMSLLTSSNDNTVKLWETNSRQQKRTLRGHGGWVVASEFLAEADDRIVSASNDASVRTWNAETYVDAAVKQSLAKVALKKESRETNAHENEIVSARFSPDGTKIVTASGDRTARIMEVDPETLAFREVTRIDDDVLDEGTPYVAMSMHADTQNGRLYIGSADATVRVWDLSLGVEIAQAKGTGLNSTFAVSTDGKRLLTGSSSPDERLLLWEVDPKGKKSPKTLHRLAVHDEAVTAMAISPDSKLLFSGDRGGYGILWDADTGKRFGQAIEAVRGFRINAAQFSRDSRSLFIAADDEQLTHIDVNTNKIVARMNHEGFVSQFALSSDNKWGLTVSELATKTKFRTAATLWNLSTGKGQVVDEIEFAIDAEDSSSTRGRRRISAVGFDESSSTAVVSRTDESHRGGIVNVVSLKSMKSTEYELPFQLGAADAIVPLDGSTLVTMNANGAFKWNLATEELLLSYRSHASLTQSSFSWDGKFVATSSRSVKIWDAANGRALAKLESPHIGPVRSVVMAPTKTNGESSYLFATAGDDSVVRTWLYDKTSNTISKVRELSSSVRNEPINRICFSPDSSQLFAVGDSGFACVFHLNKDAPEIELHAQDAGDLACAAFSSDGKVVAAGSSDKTVRVWSLAEEQLGRIAEKKYVKLEGHAGEVKDIVLEGSLAKELRVITVSASDAKIWDPKIDPLGNFTDPKGREVLSLRGHKGDITAVDVTNNGQLLMTASTDGTVILWPAKNSPKLVNAENPNENNENEKPEEANLFDYLEQLSP